MRVIIAGSRKIDKYNILIDAINESGYQIKTVVSGGANGADKLGEQYAINNDLELDVHKANWDLHGKRAGYLRNKEMSECADALIALWDGESRGTKHMINLATKAGLKVYVKTIHNNGWIEGIL